MNNRFHWPQEGCQKLNPPIKVYEASSALLAKGTKANREAMIQRRLIDAIASTDTETRMWKSLFAAAKGAYAIADFKQCESLLLRALEKGKSLKESTFAINTCLVGQGALCLATGKLDEACKHLEQPIQRLNGTSDIALKELCAVALKFHAAVLSEKGNNDGAESDLEKAIEILESIGVEGAVQLAYAMSDLAMIYMKQGALKEAGELVFSAMEILEVTMGHENPEYIRANLIYSLCHSANEEEFLGGIEDSIVKMEYQRGQQHPSIVRAVRWYLQKLHECGDDDRIAEVKRKFEVHTAKIH